MAFRASGNWSSMIQQRRSFSTTTATPTLTQVRKSFWRTAAAAPLMMVGGLVVIAGSIAIHTAKQQLVHNPNVYFNKRRRETMPEVEEPTRAVKSGGKYIDKSFLRKVAHIQDDTNNTIPNTVRGNIYTRSREAETLDSIKG